MKDLIEVEERNGKVFTRARQLQSILTEDMQTWLLL